MTPRTAYTSSHIRHRCRRHPRRLHAGGQTGRHGQTAPAPAASAAEQKKIAITAIADHPALDTIRAGVLDGLKAEGFEEGKNLTVDFQSAQGSTANAAQIAKKIRRCQPRRHHRHHHPERAGRRRRH